MVVPKDRLIIFLFGCIPIRLLPISIITMYPKSLILFCILYSLFAIIFLSIYLNPTKKIGAFGGDIWWNDMRLINSLFYFMFVLMCLSKPKYAKYMLIPDVIIGIVSIITHYKKLNYI